MWERHLSCPLSRYSLELGWIIVRGIIRIVALLLLAGAVVMLALVNHPLAAPPFSPPRLPIAPPVPSPTPTPPPLPVAPAHGTIPGWLHTDGTRIVDMRGHTVRLAAVNWYGGELSGFVPGGLAYRPVTSILRTIKYLGFNTIRLPISSELVERNPIVTSNVGANPWFRGRHALDVLDTILADARQVGLMVILVNQRAGAGGSRTQWSHNSLLWYAPPGYTNQDWINDWVTVARRYRNNPAVIGYDLRNEPHSDGPGLEILGLGYLHHGSTWGPFEGVDNPASDWRLAAEQAGNAILAVNPNALIIVEGVEVYPYLNPLNGPNCPYNIPATGKYCADLYWWGGNLMGAKQYPVVLNVSHHLVYSPHEYGPRMHGQRWITPTMTERDWQQEMYKHWGYLLDVKGPNAAPVWVGEFGTYNYSDRGIHDTRGDSQGAWFTALIHFLQQHPTAGWAYWPINGTHPGGDDTSARAQPETYGLLTPDWNRLSRNTLLKALHTIQ